jgi:hypothetical protein
LSNEDDNLFIEIPIEEDNIKIWVPKNVLKDFFEDKTDEVKARWNTKKDEKYTSKNKTFGPLEVLELAREVFHEDDVKHKVVIDVSKIEAWKLCPKNPAGWCPSQVQGVLVGNIGFFVSLNEISNQLIERLPNMGDEDKIAYLQSLILILQNTSILSDEQKNPFIAMLQQIINDLEKVE